MHYKENAKEPYQQANIIAKMFRTDTHMYIRQCFLRNGNSHVYDKNNFIPNAKHYRSCSTKIWNVFWILLKWKKNEKWSIWDA